MHVFIEGFYTSGDLYLDNIKAHGSVGQLISKMAEEKVSMKSVLPWGRFSLIGGIFSLF